MSLYLEPSIFNVVLISGAIGILPILGTLPFFFFHVIYRKLYDFILGFGGGLMLSAATLGLLAHALESGEILLVTLGFICGIIGIIIMDRLIPHFHAGGHKVHVAQSLYKPKKALSIFIREEGDEKALRQGILIISVMTIHRLPEGFAIGTSFASKSSCQLGLLMAIAIGFHAICAGIVMSVPLLRGGVKHSICCFIIALSGIVTPFTAILGFLFIHHLAKALPLGLSFAAGSLIYLTSNEILPESHSHGNEFEASVGLMLGFILIMLLHSIVGHPH
jgi:ZIP family zinc transporter